MNFRGHTKLVVLLSVATILFAWAAVRVAGAGRRDEVMFNPQPEPPRWSSGLMGITEAQELQLNVVSVGTNGTNWAYDVFILDAAGEVVASEEDVQIHSGDVLTLSVPGTDLGLIRAERGHLRAEIVGHPVGGARRVGHRPQLIPMLEVVDLASGQTRLLSRALQVSGDGDLASRGTR